MGERLPLASIACGWRAVPRSQWAARQRCCSTLTKERSPTKRTASPLARCSGICLAVVPAAPHNHPRAERRVCLRARTLVVAVAAPAGARALVVAELDGATLCTAAPLESSGPRVGG